MTDATKPNAQGLHMPWVDSPLFESELAACDADPAIKELARTFARDGLVVLDGQFEMSTIDALVEQYPWLFDPASTFDIPRHVDEVMRRDPNRRQDAWCVSEPLRQLTMPAGLLEMLEFLYQRRPFPFQILNFLRGSQQGPHSDQMHFDSLPRGFMCGVWVALEDVTMENGPLFYYPGSHRLPVIGLEHFGMQAENQTLADGECYRRYEVYLVDALEQGGFEQQKLEMKKGQAVVWHANVVHGGSPIENPEATRMSQVTHYFFDDCIYFAPILSNTAIGELRLKSVYDIAQHKNVPHRLNGQPVETMVMPNGTHRVGTLGNLDHLVPRGHWWRRFLRK